MNDPIARVMLICAMVVFTGCLGDPEGQPCGDLPPGTPGCDPADMAPPDAAVAPTEDATVPDAVADQGQDMASGCAPGSSRACGTSVGACEPGEAFCGADGGFSMCLGAIEPSDEVCNQVDDDCDGTVDEVDGGCRCNDGDMRPCGTDEGLCTAGRQACEGGLWAACFGAVEPTDERCDGQDNDCDGIVDNVPAVEAQAACAIGVGECARDGRITCAAPEEDQPTCDAVAGDPLPEQCNGRDDDCDARVDEGIEAQPTRQITDGVDHERRPGIAGVGASHAVVWATDRRESMYGLARDGAWTTDPFICDVNPVGAVIRSLAIDGAPAHEGSVLAIGLAGPETGVYVYRLDSGGEVIGERHRADIGTSYGVAVKAAGAGFGVAWHDATNEDIPEEFVRFEYVAEPGAAPWRVSLPVVDRRLHSPRLAWNGRSFGLTWIDNGTIAHRLGRVMFAHLDPDDRDAALAPVIISEAPTAKEPDIQWIPGQGVFAVAWTDWEGGPPEQRISVAMVDPIAGTVGPAVPLGRQVEARRPALMPNVSPAGQTTEIGVAYEHGAADSTGIALTWLLWDRGAERWRVSPQTTSLLDEFLQGTGPVGVHTPEAGYGLAFIEQSPERLWHITGDLGCAGR